MNTDIFEQELNRLYTFDMDKYLNEVNDLKRMGYKIFRNSKGEHKVAKPVKSKQSDIVSLFSDMFGFDMS